MRPVKQIACCIKKEWFTKIFISRYKLCVAVKRWPFHYYFFGGVRLWGLTGTALVAIVIGFLVFSIISFSPSIGKCLTSIPVYNLHLVQISPQNITGKPSMEKTAFETPLPLKSSPIKVDRGFSQ
jgi:hypothetical protein